MKTVLVDGKLIHPDKFKGYADKNETYPFKNRTIDLEKPIRVYRKLNKKGTWYSIKQNNLVVAHSKALCIANCKFIISKSGQKRCRMKKERNVHAFIEGTYSCSGMGTTAEKNELPCKIYYNPFKTDTFMADNGIKYPVKGAMFVICNHEGVKAAYTEELR